MKSTKQLLTILDELYRRVYASIGQDWDKMKESGETKQEGFFMRYWIDAKKEAEIVDEVLNGLNKFEKKSISEAYYLGAAPMGNF